MTISNEEFNSDIDNRINLLSFLSVVLSRPPTKELLEQIRSVYAENDDSIYNMVKLDDIEVEFATLFHVPSTSCLYPYESFYLSPETYELVDEPNTVGGPINNEIKALYDRFGYNYLAVATETPDHLGCELGFLVALAQQEKAALNKGDNETVKTLQEEQKQFLNQHLLKWLPTMVNKAKTIPSSGFYLSFLELTQELLENWTKSL